MELAWAVASCLASCSGRWSALLVMQRNEIGFTVASRSAYHHPTVPPACKHAPYALCCDIHSPYRERKCVENYTKQHNKFIFKLQSAFWYFQTITVSECCLIKLLLYILFQKYIYILALEMVSPGNQHSALSTMPVLSAHFCSLLVVVMVLDLWLRRSRFDSQPRAFR